MNPPAKVRMLCACFGQTVFFTLFSYRLVFLQVVENDKYVKLAEKKHGITQVTYASRGLIEDINGEILADNNPTRTVIADASLVSNAADLAGLLAGPLQM